MFRKVYRSLIISVFFIIISTMLTSNVSNAETGMKNFNNAPRLHIQVDTTKYSDITIKLVDGSGLQSKNAVFSSVNENNKETKLTNKMFTNPKINNKSTELTYTITKKYLGTDSKKFPKKYHVKVTDNSGNYLDAYFRIGIKNNHYTIDREPRIDNWSASGSKINFRLKDLTGISSVEVIDLNSNKKVLNNSNIKGGNDGSIQTIDATKLKKVNGKYKLKIQATDSYTGKLTGIKQVVFSLSDNIEKKLEDIANKKTQEEAKMKAEDEAMKREQEANEAANKKAQEEAKKKEAEEAKKKAEEEAKKKAQEEAKLKAEEEAKKREQEANEAANKKAQEEAKKEEQNTNKELKIINIDTGTNGDAVLLESKGKYLLMDTGTGFYNPMDNKLWNEKPIVRTNNIITKLKQNNVKNLSLYLSHWHSDHFDMILDIINDEYFNVENIYLPKFQYMEDNKEKLDKTYVYYHNNEVDKSGKYTVSVKISEEKLKQKIRKKYASQFKEVKKQIEKKYGKYESNKDYNEIKDFYTKYEKKWMKANGYAYYGNASYNGRYNHYTVSKSVSEKIKQRASEKKIKVIDLWRGDSFKLGDATANVIGPFELKKENYTEGHYINNNSLVTMIKVGKTKFLTAGDIEKEQEQLLIENNVDVSADIMKASHHGNTTSNITEFIEKVNPKYAFYARPNMYSGGGSLVNFTSNTKLYGTGYNGTEIFEIKNNTITVSVSNNKEIVLNQTKKNDKEKEKVDVVLFWGQSNMVGYSGIYENERSKDKRNLNNIIDNDILKQYKQMNYVSVQIPSKVAYEYKIDSDGKGYLSEINKNTKFFGENLTYKNGKLYPYNTKTKKSLGYYSIQQSFGTNMIPQFCKTYYELTGRKVIVILAAKGGEKISNFLPNGDANNTDNKYIYEAIKTKYNNAISYLNKNSYSINNKFYVAFQGGADATASLSNKYYDTYLKVHNKLKEDLNLSFGAIVEIGGKINTANEKDEYILNVHNAQRELVSKNTDIILGSDFSYKMYTNKNKNAYCLEKSTKANSNDKYDNSVHLTSASLSQIGKETANQIANKVK